MSSKWEHETWCELPADHRGGCGRYLPDGSRLVETWRVGPPALDCLIFSRDRAAQLDLLLRSIAEHAPGLYSTIWVLFLASTDGHLAGYVRCREEHFGGLPVRFQRQGDSFNGDVRAWLAFAGELVTFLVDDDVFYRSAPALAELAELVPVSLRGGDYDYPFSVDGNIYRREHVEHLLAGLLYRDPTELEWFAHEHRHRLPFARVSPCPGGPCLVGVPANRVSPTSTMPHMGMPVEMLNRLYLAGKRLEIDPPPGVELGAHYPLSYRMRAAA